MLRLSTYVFFAVVYHLTFKLEWAATLEADWMLYVFVRNLAVMALIYGGLLPWFFSFHTSV